MARLPYAEAAHQRLLDAWTGQAEFGDPIGCVATTFTFDSAFFEEQCLSRFLRIQNDPAEDIRGYLVEREERLSQASAFVFVDRGHVPKLRSLRWHVLPMTVPGGGVFHAKVTLLLWEKHARVLVASANLTDFGYRRNYEHMAVLDYGPDGDVPLTALRDVIAFIREARKLSPGMGKDAGPQAALERFLLDTERQIRTWPAGEWGKGEPRCSLLVARPGATDVFSQLADLWNGSPADVAWVCSPFFSPPEDVHRTVAGLERLLRQRGPRAITFVGRGWKLADGTVMLQMPATLREPSAAAVTHQFAFTSDVSSDDRAAELRTLHAKSLWIQRGPRLLFLVGSSNFTAAGMGLGPVINVEANLAYDIGDVSSPFGKTCEAAYPPHELVDLDAQKVQFQDDAGDRTPEPEPYAPLPEAFGLLLLRLDDDNATLDLEILASPPKGFSVVTPSGTEIASEATWVSEGRPPQTLVAWADAKPPTFLLVTWRTAEGTAEALWIVNVADASKLPPPDELRELALEDLLELLTSARPYHEVMNKIWRRRESRQGMEGGSALTDPHRRIDTSGFVIQRMRRIGAALEGMKERLERPVFTIDALRWRLHGPLGPLALAKRLAAEEREGAAFMIAEVALTVHDTQLNASGDLGVVDAPREKQQLLDHLKRLAIERGAPPNLEEYVRRTFSELTS